MPASTTLTPNPDKIVSKMNSKTKIQYSHEYSVWKIFNKILAIDQVKHIKKPSEAYSGNAKLSHIQK